jgi:uncharacterized protein (DUF362 family)
MEDQQSRSEANNETSPRTLDRRAMLVGAVAAGAGIVGYRLLRHFNRPQEPVFLARGQSYDGPLGRTIRDGLLAVEIDPLWLSGRRVLLKPNLVEPTRQAPHLTTHPAVVLAAAEVFRQWGAQVIVGEGPGHVRDTEMALVESGLEEALRGEKIPFADLNYSPAQPVANKGRLSSIAQFFFPREVREADLIVSMPKLKTHHWVGMTAAMKNLYGLLPGMIYGWPKNVLHHAGIPETVVDINATAPRHIAIVDAILCMEGDGPIMGTPKPLGLLAIGGNCTAVDAACARIVGLDPAKVPYLALAADRLGPTDEAEIIERGERWQDVASPFQIVDTPHLREMRAGGSS